MFTTPTEQVIDPTSISQSIPAAACTLEIIDIDTAAKLIDRQKGTIYNLVNQKKIPFIRHGRRLFFSRATLLKWMASQTEIYSGSEVLQNA